MIICNGVVPQLLWFKKLRTHVPTLFVVCSLINIGMWFERYVIIITGLSREYDPGGLGPLHAEPGRAHDRAPAASRFFSMLFLIFLKLFPVIAISEVKELEIHERAHGHRRRTRRRTDGRRWSASSTDRATSPRW